MSFKKTIALQLCFFILATSSCDFKDDSTNEKKLSTDKLGKLSLAEGRKAEIRDGEKLLPRPGGQVNYERVDSKLESLGISFSDIVNAKEKNKIRNNVNKLSSILSKDEITNDNELKFSVQSLLGIQYFHLYGVSGQKNTEYVDEAIANLNAAISIYENKPAYKADLADCYSALVSAYVVKGNYDKAVSTLKYLVENFQDIGYRPYKNWYASEQLGTLNNLAHGTRYKLDPRDKESIISYLKMISTKYDNEVGITAQMELTSHNLSDNKKEINIQSYMQSLEERVSALDNPAFKVNKWNNYKEKIELQRKNEELRSSSK